MPRVVRSRTTSVPERAPSPRGALTATRGGRDLASTIGNRAFGRLLARQWAKDVDDPSEVATCRVDVRATSTPIGGTHLYIVHRNERGNEFGYRAGPSGRGGTGYIEGDFGRYAADTFPDYDPGSPSVTVAERADACGIGDAFADELLAITAARIPYSIAGPNSNTVISHLLERGGLPRLTPVADPIGWDDELYPSHRGEGGAEGAGPAREPSPSDGAGGAPPS